MYFCSGQSTHFCSGVDTVTVERPSINDSAVIKRPPAE
jgi:hypothetical protein